MHPCKYVDICNVHIGVISERSDDVLWPLGSMLVKTCQVYWSTSCHILQVSLILPITTPSC